MLGRILEVSFGAKFNMSLSNYYVNFTPELLYSSTRHVSDAIFELKTGLAHDARLQGLHESRYFLLDIGRFNSTVRLGMYFTFFPPGLPALPDEL